MDDVLQCAVLWFKVPASEWLLRLCLLFAFSAGIATMGEGRIARGVFGLG
jgi:hypothetical protein